VPPYLLKLLSRLVPSSGQKWQRQRRADRLRPDPATAQNLLGAFLMTCEKPDPKLA
jgi:hypothetical protein